jgi:N-acyl homoserine lactone hydrolase
MDRKTSEVKKLYLMRLSEVTVPIGGGRSIEMSSGCYLLEMNDGTRILVDSGMAADGAGEVPSGTPKARNEKNVLEHLEELGVRPEQIELVVCTHFDVDHVGYHEHFVNAEFVVQRQHYELAKGGHRRYAGCRRHWDDPRLKYRLVEGDAELRPGVELLETSGHCIGHQSVLVRLRESGPVLLAIDAAILGRLFTMDRKASPNDENEAMLLASTKKLLEAVERESVKLVVFGHDGEQWGKLRRAPEFYE